MWVIISCTCGIFFPQSAPVARRHVFSCSCTAVKIVFRRPTAFCLATLLPFDAEKLHCAIPRHGNITLLIFDASANTYTHVCTCAHAVMLCTQMYVCTCTCASTQIHVCVRTTTRVQTRACVGTCLCTKNTCVCEHTNTNVRIRACTGAGLHTKASARAPMQVMRARTHTHTHTHVSRHKNAAMYTHMYMRMWKFTFVRQHTHTHTDVCTNVCACAHYALNKCARGPTCLNAYTDMCVCAPICICSRPLPDAHARVGAEMRVTDACTYTCARGKNVLSPNIELYTYLRECAHVCLSWKCVPDMPFCSHICEHKSFLRANTSVCPRLHYVVPNTTTGYNIVICIATDYYILLHYIAMYYNIWSFDGFYILAPGPPMAARHCRGELQSL